MSAYHPKAAVGLGIIWQILCLRKCWNAGPNFGLRWMAVRLRLCLLSKPAGFRWLHLGDL